MNSRKAVFFSFFFFAYSFAVALQHLKHCLTVMCTFITEWHKVNCTINIFHYHYTFASVLRV